ncbi:MAG TPA: preprotein translocase subunit YajC [Ilumatobacteraceae bacterium]|nr:preprotein translocase subunit YajC [Ilumatobacteraceae bacterium]
MSTLSLLASSSSDDGGGGSVLLSILPFLLIGVAMYYLLIRPQRRRQREAVALQSSIEIGDEVMTTSGVYGFVTGFEGDIAWLEIDDNIQIRIARQAIQRKVDTTKGETAVPTDDGSGKSKIDDPASAIDDADES